MTHQDLVPTSRRRFVLAATAACVAPAFILQTARAADVDALLAAACRPLVEKHDLPGLVVGLVFEGRAHYFESGTTARQGGSAATRHTIFELGSISKCFTSTLAALAQVQGRWHLDRPVGDGVPELRGTPIGRATPLHLATYTAGGLPLQFPDDVPTNDKAMAYLAAFQPSALHGAIRQYSNPSVGLLGHATAVAMAGDFTALSEASLFAPLGLGSTHINVPEAEKHRYAWGHDKNQRQVRVNPGAFDAQAYGVKSTASDMLRFLQAVLEPERMPPALRQAVSQTLVPRYQVGPMQQGMGWEMYPWPAPLEALQAGNGPRTVLEPLPVQAIGAGALPLEAPASKAVFLNKSGSTFGFGGYVALVPNRQTALVMLANRNFPVADRVQATRQVMASLGVLG